MNILKRACVFIGMAVGAGFASGREVTDFFLVFGPDWDKGLLFGGILFFITACAISYIVRKHNIKDYPEFLSVRVNAVSQELQFISA